MPFVETARLRFHYREQGDARGLPMLLLHGSHASSRWWLPVFQVLPQDVRAIAPDLRGCGQSDKPESGYDIDAQAEDIRSFIHALGLRQIDLVAHSSAAALAIELALRHPTLLSTLTLISPPSLSGIPTPVEALTLLAAMRADRALHGQALAALMPSLDRTQPANASLFDALVDDAQAMAPAAFTAIAVSLGRWDRLGDAGRLTLPTLLIWGELDTIIARDSVTRTLIAIPGANNLEILPGVGHSPMIEDPLLLVERIVDFIVDDNDAYAALRHEAMQAEEAHAVASAGEALPDDPGEQDAGEQDTENEDTRTNGASDAHEG